MKWMNRLRASLAVLALVGMVLPRWGFASETTAAAPALDIIDVTLHEDGTLRGQVMDSQGVAVAAAVVAVVHQGKVVATTFNIAPRLKDHLEVRDFLSRLSSYALGDKFRPDADVSPADFLRLFRPRPQ